MNVDTFVLVIAGITRARRECACQGPPGAQRKGGLFRPAGIRPMTRQAGGPRGIYRDSEPRWGQ